MLPHDEWMAVCAVLSGLKSLIAGLEESACCRCGGRSHKRLMVIVASGLVLGEGTASIANAFIKAIFG